MEILARGLGEPADGVLAEHRLQQPLPDDGGAAGDADLQPGQSGGHGEHHNHQGGAEAVDAEGQPAGLGALALALGPDQFHQAPLPGPDLGGSLLGEALGGSGEVVGAQQLAAGRIGTPAPVGILGRVGGLIDDDGLQAGFDRRLHPHRRRRFAPEERTDPVAEAADVLLHGPEELAGAHEVLPAGQDLAPQQGAVPGGLKDPGHGVPVGVPGVPGEDIGGVFLVAGGLRHRLDAAAQGLDGPVERPPGDVGPAGGVRGEFLQPEPQRLHGRGRKHPHPVQGRLGDDEEAGRRPGLPC